MNIKISNGRVVDASQNFNQISDIYIADSMIVAIGSEPEDFNAEEIIDATGLVVCPGLIDICAQIPEPGFSQKGSIASETKAAVAGGITTLVSPPNTSPIVDSTAVVELIIERSFDTGYAKVLPMGALTKGLAGEQLSPLYALANSGCIAFTNGRTSLQNNLTLLRTLEYAATYDLLIQFQPEDLGLAAGGHMHESATSTRLGLNGIPSAAETTALATALILVEHTGVRAHFGQLSCAESVEMISAARTKGLAVSADVAIQNLLLTDESVASFNSNLHLRPPLRGKKDLEALRQGLVSGAISAICSDHQPHELAAKEAPFAATVTGMAGLETLLPLALELVRDNVLSLPQLLTKLTSGPAEVLGLDRAVLKPGAVADICIFDPEEDWQLSAETSYSGGKNTVFMQQPLKGRVQHTLVNGVCIYSQAN